jgi:hypothetical protein
MTKLTSNSVRYNQVFVTTVIHSLFCQYNLYDCKKIIAQEETEIKIAIQYY